MRYLFVCSADLAAEEFGAALAMTTGDPVLRLDAPSPRRMSKVVRFQPDVILIRPPAGARASSSLQLVIEFATFGRRPVVALLTSEELRETGRPRWANDVLIAPYRRERLQAVVRSLGVEDQPPGDEASVLACGDVELTEAERAVRVRGRPVALPFVEFEVLRQLLRRRGHLVPRSELLPRTPGRRPPSLRAVDVYVRRIRQKLASARGFTIETVRRFGYRCVEEDSHSVRFSRKRLA